MPETAKFVMGGPGQEPVEIEIGPNDGPISLADLMERARRKRATLSEPMFWDPDDLEDVLDSYRLAGRMCGVQVFAVDHVVAWTGDIERIREPMDGWRLRGHPEPGPVFFKCLGANAIEEAGKWLRAQLATLPPNPLPAGWGQNV